MHMNEFGQKIYLVLEVVTHQLGELMSNDTQQSKRTHYAA